MTLATRVAVMRGNVEQYADPASIYDRPASLFVASFVGSPAMNFLHGNCAARAARAPSRLRRRAASGGLRFGRPARRGRGNRPRHPPGGSHDRQPIKARSPLSGQSLPSSSRWEPIRSPGSSTAAGRLSARLPAALAPACRASVLVRILQRHRYSARDAAAPLRADTAVSTSCP